jgi:hypothetical protein
MAESHREEIEKLEALIAAHPEGRVFAHLAEAYRKSGNLVRAQEVLQTGLLRHPDYASAHVVLGRVLRDAGEAERAMASFQRVLELDPGNLVALRSLGELASQLGWTRQAILYFRELLILEPASEGVAEWVEQLEADAGREHAPAPVDVAAVGASGGDVFDATVNATTIVAATSVAASVDAVPMDTSPIEAATIDTASIEAAIEAAAIDTSPIDTSPIDTVPIDPVVVADLPAASDDGDGGPARDSTGIEAMTLLESVESFEWLDSAGPVDDLEPVALVGINEPAGPVEPAADLMVAANEVGDEAGESPVVADVPGLLAAGAGLEVEGVEGVEGLEGVETVGGWEPIGLDLPDSEAIGFGGQPISHDPVQPAAADGLESGSEPGVPGVQGWSGGESATGLDEEVGAGARDAAGAATGSWASMQSYQSTDDEDPFIESEEDAAITTETMAELYRKQGLLDRAAAIYRKLLGRRPDDEQLASKLAQIEGVPTAAASSPIAADTEPAEQLEPVAAVTDGADAEVDAADSPQLAGSQQASHRPLEEIEAAWTGAHGALADEASPYAWHAAPETGAAVDQPADGITIGEYLTGLLAWRPGREPAAPAESSVTAEVGIAAAAGAAAVALDSAAQAFVATAAAVEVTDDAAADADGFAEVASIDEAWPEHNLADVQATAAEPASADLHADLARSVFAESVVESVIDEAVVEELAPAQAVVEELAPAPTVVEELVPARAVGGDATAAPGYDPDGPDGSQPGAVGEDPFWAGMTADLERALDAVDAGSGSATDMLSDQPAPAGLISEVDVVGSASSPADSSTSAADTDEGPSIDEEFERLFALNIAPSENPADAAEAGDDSPTPQPVVPAEELGEDDDDDDLQMFRSWLQSLKR